VEEYDLVSGDISACFDEIDHRTLEKILRERISDERFIRLTNKILKAGYFDMQHIYHGTETGNARGSCRSPILCNIHLDKLDRFMESIIEIDTTGNYRRQNPRRWPEGTFVICYQKVPSVLQFICSLVSMGCQRAHPRPLACGIPRDTLDT